MKGHVLCTKSNVRINQTSQIDANHDVKAQERTHNAKDNRCPDECMIGRRVEGQFKDAVHMNNDEKAGNCQSGQQRAKEVKIVGFSNTFVQHCQCKDEI